MVFVASGSTTSMELLIACAAALWSLALDDPPSSSPPSSPSISPSPSTLSAPEPARSLPIAPLVQPYAPSLSRNNTSQVSVFTEDAAMQGHTPVCLAFEKNGAVWVAYTGGLKRFDGYRWQSFGPKEGLPTDFARCVTIAADGKVWIGTDRGVAVSEPGSERFARFEPPGGLAGPSVRRIVQGPDGALWFCCDRFPNFSFSGGLTRWREGDGAAKHYGPADGLPSDRIHHLFFDSTGQAFALGERGAACFREGRWVRFLEDAGLEEANQPLFGMAESPRYGLMIAGQSEIFQQRTPDSPWTRRKVAGGMPLVLATASDGEIYAPMKRDSPAVLCRWSDSAQTFESVAELEKEGLHNFFEDIRKGPDGSIWIAGPGFLARWVAQSAGEWVFFRNMPPPLFQDRFGILWFAWPEGNYAIRCRDSNANAAWEEILHFNGRSMMDQTGQVWQYEGSVVRQWKQQGWTDYDLRPLGIERVLSFCVDPSGVAWVLGESSDPPLFSAVFGEQGGRSGRWAGNPSEPLPLPSLSLVRPSPDPPAPAPWQWSKTAWNFPKSLRYLKNSPIWSDPSRGVWTIVADKNNQFRALQLNREGGRQAKLPLQLQPRPDAWGDHLDASSIRGVLTSRGDLWLFGRFGAAILDTRSLTFRESDTISAGSRKIIEGEERGPSIWFAAASWLGGSNGLLELRGDRWIFRGAMRTPRFVGTRNADGSLFLFADRRVQTISADSRLFGEFMVPGHPQDVASVVKDRSNTVWVGSWSNELGRFRPDRIPPDTILQASERDVTQGRRLHVDAIGVEKFRSRFEGREMRFSWRFDDQIWSNFSRTLHLPSTEGLPVGRHILEVRAMDEGNDIDPTPERLEFHVHSIPLQQRPWFGPGLAGFAGLVSMLGLWGLRSSVIAKRARDAAEKANRVKLAILSNVNHEIRTPMNAIQSMTRLLQGTRLTAEQADFADSIRKGGQALMAIIDGLFDFAEIDRGLSNIEFKPFATRPWAEAIASSYEGAAAEKHLTFVARIAPNVPPWLVGDSERLTMAARQILDNAFKFTDRGGVELELSWRMPSGSAPLLTISVFDSGAGLPPQAHARLFQPFSQLDAAWSRRYGGIGLGLAICSRLVERLGGRVWSEPRPVRGSVFRLEIPAPVPARLPEPSASDSSDSSDSSNSSYPSKSRMSSSAPGSNSDRSGNGGSKSQSCLTMVQGFDSGLGIRRPLSILVVEDLALNRKVIGLMLKRFGYEPEFAAHGGEAVAALEGRPFDLVLMDLQMPEMDGLEATRIIRQRWGAKGPPRIVALTANNLPSDRQAAFEAGMDGFLAKPVSPEDLAQCLHRTDQALPA